MKRRPAPAQERPEDSPLWYRGDVRTASGERGNGDPWGHHFSLLQARREGEYYMPPGYPKRAGIHHCIGILPLNDGTWIARPETPAGHRGEPYGDGRRHYVRLEFHVGSRRHATREAALRTAVAQVIRLAKWAKRERARGTLHLSLAINYHPQHADELVAWALSLLELPAPAPVYVAPPPPPPPRVIRPGEQFPMFAELP